MRRVVIALASLVSAPGMLLSAAACAYIAWSIATEPWYRRTFLGDGAVLAGLYLAVLVGVTSIAWIALRGNARGRASAAALALAALGIAAAIVIELELWDEAERLLPLGLLVAPFAAWAVAAWCLRRWPASLPPAASPWEDTRA